MNYSSYFKKSVFQKGFTLIETLFAILIFSVALVSLLLIAGRGISATGSARQQITAHYLAQEGLEVVRNMRDQNFINVFIDENSNPAPSWSDGFSSCQSGRCIVKYNDQTPGQVPGLEMCQGNDCPVYELDGFFMDPGSGATPSGYERLIKITAVSFGGITEYHVECTVTWEAKGVERSLTLQTFLKKWM